MTLSFKFKLTTGSDIILENDNILLFYALIDNNYTKYSKEITAKRMAALAGA